MNEQKTYSKFLSAERKNQTTVEITLTFFHKFQEI